jgi:2Fe-2S ferredoxin
MPKVTFTNLPGGSQTYDVRAGDSILDCGINHDVPIQHACGGFCACTTCQVTITAGGENLSEMEEDEDERLDRVAQSRTDASRLGCQAKVHGDVTVQIVNLED